MNKDVTNFSTDLLRISSWIYLGEDKLAKQFLDLCYRNYSRLKTKVGCYEDIWEEIKKIENRKENRYRRAERALTLSRILLMFG